MYFSSTSSKSRGSYYYVHIFELLKVRADEELIEKRLKYSSSSVLFDRVEIIKIDEGYNLVCNDFNIETGGVK